MRKEEVLTREQLKKITGGQTPGSGNSGCYIYSNGVQIDHLYAFGAGHTSCSDQSATTRDKADYYASNGYSNVTYDCGCDGYGS